jgi:hypothetical protein
LGALRESAMQAGSWDEDKLLLTAVRALVSPNEGIEREFGLRTWFRIYTFLAGFGGNLGERSWSEYYVLSTVQYWSAK